MSRILPAILSDKFDEYKDGFAMIEKFPNCDKIHIDIMDGEFVETKSIPLREILQIPTNLKKQVHLMVRDPLPYLELCHEFKVEEMVFHFEANFDFAQNIKGKYPTKLFLAINPATEVRQIENILQNFDGILIMTVIPGKQGGGFLPENLGKISQLRSAGFTGRIVADGGVNLNTIDEVLKNNPDEMVVGSGIVKQENPLEAYLKLDRISFLR